MNEPSRHQKRPRGTPKELAGLFLGFLIVMLLVSIVHPVQPPVRELSKQAICMANLSGIGKGVWLYENENPGSHPPDLATLVHAHFVPSKMLVCPSSGTKSSPTTRPADIEAHCDYVYVPGMSRAPGEYILAFELPANHGQEGVSVLYAAGNVKFQKDISKFIEELQRVNDYLAENRRAE